VSDDLVAAVVKRGVVLAPGLDQNGVEHWATKWVEHYPGDTVMLPAAEVARLQQIGALLSTSMGYRRTIPT
jgi:hypothetical protein